MNSLKEHLIDQLTREHAHIGFVRATKGIDTQHLGKRTDALPHSIWELAEHIRIAQEDILKFCVNSNYEAPSWPDDYWPSDQAPSDRNMWEQTLQQYQDDRQKMVELVEDPQNDLFEPFPHGDGQTLFREAVLIIDHTSYHTGQIVDIQRILGIW
ncbi:MAG: DinB family protein [Balneolaceae bacterium]|nr:DinB family protein [Balneolaceae bacterium]